MAKKIGNSNTSTVENPTVIQPGSSIVIQPGSSIIIQQGNPQANTNDKKEQISKLYELMVNAWDREC